MKQLYLLRHAKSSWDDDSLDDFDRPLNPRGKKAAPLMGKVVKERDIAPDIILCSPAKRTKQTIKLVNETAKLKADVTFEEAIYDSSAADLRKLLKKQKKSVGSILLIGHNPGLEELLEQLTGKYEPLPTAALVQIDVNSDDWSHIKDGANKLAWIVRPKDLE
jgi:Phosphohistidine phosphatase SixA